MVSGEVLEKFFSNQFLENKQQIPIQTIRILVITVIEALIEEISRKR
jgi:hypothetical protein